MVKRKPLGELEQGLLKKFKQSQEENLYSENSDPEQLDMPVYPNVKQKDMYDIPPEPIFKPLTVEEAKELDQQNKTLREAFAKASQESNNKWAPLYQNVKQKDIIDIPPKPTVKPLTVEEAKRLEELERKLRAEFAAAQTNIAEELRQREKEYEPITRAIREQQQNQAELKQKDEEIKELRKQIRMKQLTKFRPRALSTPAKQDDNTEDVVTHSQDQSIQEFVTSRGVGLGPIARQYLPEARDSTFGIWYDLGDQQLKIGHSTINIKNNDIILNKLNKKYEGTEGLWRLLTTNNFIQPVMYTPEDWNNYKDILIKTDSMYQNNDPGPRRPKSSSGQKWKKMVKLIWDDYLLENRPGSSYNSGSGLKEYNEKPIEYKYIGNYNELIDRLFYIQAQEDAGNNNFNNEKLSVVKFIHDRLMEVVAKPNALKYMLRCITALPVENLKDLINRLYDIYAEDENGEKVLVVRFINDYLEELILKPNGVKYIARCLSALPERVIEGSGLLNDIINNLPFELHAPGMQFIGPGTKLQERLARGDKGANRLDTAARDHDIWYSKHKKTEDRWVADKVLQDKAFERVVAPDADPYERLLGLATGSAMWAKRKLGMGLTMPTSGYIYPVPKNVTPKSPMNFLDVN